MRERAEWLRTRIVASMWWCGDYHCDCTQPIVERIEPNQEAGFPWLKRTRLWEGTFYSAGFDGERSTQWAELRAAAERFGAEKHWKPEDEPTPPPKES